MLVFSLYHNYFSLEHGTEVHPTFFMHRNINKPYHIDYCFASRKFNEKLKSVEIGDYNDWIGYSDHMLLIIDDPAGIRTQGPNIYKYTFLLFLNVNLRCTEV